MIDLDQLQRQIAKMLPSLEVTHVGHIFTIRGQNGFEFRVDATAVTEQHVPMLAVRECERHYELFLRNRVDRD